MWGMLFKLRSMAIFPREKSIHWFGWFPNKRHWTSEQPSTDLIELWADVCNWAAKRELVRSEMKPTGHSLSYHSSYLAWLVAVTLVGWAHFLAFGCLSLIRLFMFDSLQRDTNIVMTKLACAHCPGQWPASTIKLCNDINIILQPSETNKSLNLWRLRFPMLAWHSHADTIGDRSILVAPLGLCSTITLASHAYRFIHGLIPMLIHMLIHMHIEGN